MKYINKYLNFIKIINNINKTNKQKIHDYTLVVKIKIHCFSNK